jgi:lipooligosaccharide transport system permease protein
MTAPPVVRVAAPARFARVLPSGLLGRRAGHVVERNVLTYRRTWPVFLTGFVEPVLYLLSIGIGVGALVGDLPGPDGTPLPYQTFVAPGLFAAAAMNGAVFDTTFNFFVKFKYSKTYDSMLATPLGVSDIAAGEIGWAVLRGTVYAGAFLAAMVLLGLVGSWWAVLAVPAAALIAFGFAGAGLAATTWMRSFIDFDYVNLAVIPLFLFSATFFPLERYPDAVAAVVRWTPLYQGVHLVRSLTLGDVGPGLVVPAAYLAVMGLGGLAIAARRLERLLLP